MTATHTSLTPGVKPRVFIIEDEAITALDLKEKLALMGYEVVGVADNGHEAKARIREQGADLARTIHERNDSRINVGPHSPL